MGEELPLMGAVPDPPSYPPIGELGPLPLDIGAEPLIGAELIGAELIGDELIGALLLELVIGSEDVPMGLADVMGLDDGAGMDGGAVF